MVGKNKYAARLERVKYACFHVASRAVWCAGGYESCLHLKQSTGVAEDGEYQVLFAGKNITVYCHDMNSTVPKEYLTLHAGEGENYSEIYGKRLMEPNSCPNNGTRDENCECVADAQRCRIFHHPKSRLHFLCMPFLVQKCSPF